MYLDVVRKLAILDVNMTEGADLQRVAVVQEYEEAQRQRTSEETRSRETYSTWLPEITNNVYENK